MLLVMHKRRGEAATCMAAGLSLGGLYMPSAAPSAAAAATPPVRGIRFSGRGPSCVGSSSSAAPLASAAAPAPCHHNCTFDFTTPH